YYPIRNIFSNMILGLPWRRERLQGYLTIFTIMTNVVRELIGELNLRSVEAFLRFVERYLGGPPGLMKIFKLR
ncbi:MAG: hypothetical protein RRE78_07025, partial [Acidianus sp.]|nr:hypothetical protein [Acidianus sp.]